MKESSRRDFLKSLASGIAAVPLVYAVAPRLAFGKGCKASDVDKNLVEFKGIDNASPDALAKTTYGYYEDAKKVDAAKYPQKKSDQLCKNCQFFVVCKTKGGKTGGCNAIPGKSVNSAGWCQLWAKKM